MYCFVVDVAVLSSSGLWCDLLLPISDTFSYYLRGSSQYYHHLEIVLKDEKRGPSL